MKLDPFQVENLRNSLALKKENDSFKNSYTTKFLEIKNFNTREKWDDLNLQKQSIKISDPMAFERVSFVSKFITMGAKILDIGFGSGNLEKMISKNVGKCTLTGLDLSPKSVKKARIHYPNWDFKVGDITKSDLPGNLYDFIVALETFEHISPSKVFSCYKKVYSHLKKGGYFIISVPMNEGLDKMLEAGINPNAHVRAYTENIIKFELEVSGFEVKEVKLLYAFHKHHLVKSLIARYMPNKFKPNNIVLVAQKP